MKSQSGHATASSAAKPTPATITFNATEYCEMRQRTLPHLHSHLIRQGLTDPQFGYVWCIARSQRRLRLPHDLGDHLSDTLLAGDHAD